MPFCRYVTPGLALLTASRHFRGYLTLVSYCISNYPSTARLIISICYIIILLLSSFLSILFLHLHSSHFLSTPCVRDPCGIENCKNLSFPNFEIFYELSFVSIFSTFLLFYTLYVLAEQMPIPLLKLSASYNLSHLQKFTYTRMFLYKFSTNSYSFPIRIVSRE